MRKFILFFIVLFFFAEVSAQHPARPQVAYPFDGTVLPTPKKGVSQQSIIAKAPGDAFAASTIPTGGERLVNLQNPDGGWGWLLTGPSAQNTVGPIAMGLARTYSYNFSSTQLDALGRARTLLLNKTNTFYPSDGSLAKALDDIFGGTACRDRVTTYYYQPLAAGTYNRNGDGVLYSTPTYITFQQTMGPNYTAWNLGVGIVSAIDCGVSGTELGYWKNGVKNCIENITLGGYYDVLGLAGGLFGLAYAHEEFDPTTGPFASASNLHDLAAILASYQISLGGFAWNSAYVIPNDFDEEIQETAYAILALNSVDRNAYISNIHGAADYIASVQLNTGGWANWVGSPEGEVTEVDGEALWAYVTAYSTVNNTTKGTWNISLQSAINEATAGDVLSVYPGTYNLDEANGFDLVTGATGTTDFNIFVNKPLTIQGVDGSGTPISDYNNTAAHVTAKRNTPSGNLSTIFIQADNVTISGLDITAYNDPDYNFKTISVIGDNVTIKNCSLHNLDQLTNIYMYDPNYTSGTNTSHIQSYRFEGNYVDQGDVDAFGIRISSGAGWSGSVTNRVITGNIFTSGIYGIAFVGPGGDSWDYYPVGAATISNNAFSGVDRGSVVAWGKYNGQAGYGTLDWNAIFSTNSNTFDKAVMVKTAGGSVQYYDYSYNDGSQHDLYFIRGIYSAIQRYPLNKVAQAGDIVNVAAGTYTEQVHVTVNNLTLNGAGTASTIVKCPATLTSSFSVDAYTYKPVVFVDGVAGSTIKNLTVDGDGKGGANDRFIGVGFWNAGGTVDHVNSLNITETPFNGNQNCDGIYSNNNTGGPYSLHCSNMVINNYQKNGVTIKGIGMTVGLDNIAVTGKGATSVNAQNGIQISDGATGSVSSCTVNDNSYTGAGNWWASGIMVYGSPFVTVSGNTLDNNQSGIYISHASNNTVEDNTISNSSAGGIVVSNNYSGDPARANLIQNNTISGAWSGIWSSYCNHNTYHHNTITACTGNGIYLWDTDSNTVDHNIISDIALNTAGWGIALDGGDMTGTLGCDNNSITGNDITTSDAGIWVGNSSDNNTLSDNYLHGNHYGVQVDYYSPYGSGIPPSGLVISHNKITGNTIQGVDNNTTVAADAAGNWWGDSTGPYHATKNPCGSGDAVSDQITFMPWFTGSAMSGTATGYPPVKNITQNTYYCTIQAAVADANANDVINLSAGTYVETGQIVINKNLSIAGADKATTIIKTNQDQSNYVWRFDAPATTFSLSNVTVDFDGYNIYGGFRSANVANTTFDNCIFKNIIQSGYGGRAIVLWGDGTVSNCEFSNIGRIGMDCEGNNTKTVSLTGNTYTGKGSGDYLDYGIVVNTGATATITGNTISGIYGITSAGSYTSAAMMLSNGFGSGTSATVTDNIIKNCSYGISVGGNATYGNPVVTATNNSLTNIDYNAVESYGPSPEPSVTATCNYWGTTVASEVEYHTNGNVTFSPWLISGTDSDAGTAGFQPATGTCLGTPVFATLSSATNETCTGAGNGVISISVSGGSGSYGYLWAPGGMTTQNISGLAANTYAVTVTDLSYGSMATLAQGISTTNTLTGISNPGDMTVSTASGACTRAVTYTATATGSSATVTYAFSGATTGSGSGTGSGSTFNKGITNVTVTVSNPCPPDATATFTITVNDTEHPSISCVSSPQNRNVVTGTCTYTAITTEFDPTAVSDNCTGTTVAWVLTGATTGSGNTTLAGTTFNKGTTTVQWTATDGSSNTTSASFSVIVSDPSGIYVNDASLTGDGYCYAAGSDLNGDGSKCAPYRTLAKAIAVATTGATIYVDAGTYMESGQIVINKNLTITGLSKTTTIIQTSQATSGSYTEDGSAWFLVNTGKTFNLSQVTLDGTGQLVCNAIISHGHGTISGNIIKNIAYNQSGPDYNGAAVALYGSDMTISNNMLSAIGREGIFAAYFSTVTITGNTYTGKGSGNWLDYGIEVGHNSTATISNNTISGNTGVAVVDGSNSSGILAASYYDAPGVHTGATISSNLITGNTEGIAIGYDDTDVSEVSVHYNNLSANSDHGLTTAGASVNAINNYWGCPTVSGAVTYFPYYSSCTGTPGSFSFGSTISNITASASVNPVCSGGSTTIYATGGSDYMWDHSLGLGTSKVITPSGTTVYNVASKDGNGCPGASNSVTVVSSAPLPVQIQGVTSGSEAVILGTPKTLVATGTTSYLWSNGSTSSSITVTPTANTTYSVTGSASGCSASASYTLTVVSVTAGANKFICSGGSATLTAVVTGISSPTYYWSPANQSTQSVTVSPTISTQYTVTINGNPDLTAHVTVFVNPRPVANPGPGITIPPAGLGVLNGGASAGTAPYSYNWTTTGGSIYAGPGTPAPVVAAAGTYTIQVTDAFGCTSSPASTLVAVASSGYTVSGNVSYAFNATNNQMHDVTVTLTGTSTSFTTTTPSTGNGDYQFLGVPNGTYTVNLSSPKPWGGVTATDITMIQNHYKNPGGTLLQGIKRLAADVVDNSPSINVISNDRDLVNLKRTVPSTVFLTGNWVFTKSSNISSTTYPIHYANSGGYSDIMITVADANLVQNFSALCYGDVDASYTGLKDHEIQAVNFTTSNGLDLDNFPNPFTHQTTIRFTVPVKGSVSVRVRSLLGALGTSINDPDDYEGIHNLTYDARELAPGVYLYTVQIKTSDDILIQTGKMMIVR